MQIPQILWWCAIPIALEVSTGLNPVVQLPRGFYKTQLLIHCFCFMSVSHFHDPTSSSQNVGNHVGNRPCVRQSQLFRRNESGNAMKELMGQSSLQWDTKKLQGAYTGVAYDPNSLKVQQAVECQWPAFSIFFHSEMFPSSHCDLSPQRVPPKILKWRRNCSAPISRSSS